VPSVEPGWREAGVFGKNPSFNTIEKELVIDGKLLIILLILAGMVPNRPGNTPLLSGLLLSF
jgi:hypothetical protein